MTGIIRTPRRPDGWIAPGPAPAGAQGRPELEPEDDEDLCLLSGDWRLFQKQDGHRWSLDDLVTAWIATRRRDPARAIRALDLGCGLGSVLLMVAWKLPHAEVWGIEAQTDRAAMGRRSIAYNGVAERCRILDGDLREVTSDRLGDTRFDLVTGTPPYFPRGTGTESQKPHALACRFEVRGGVESYLETAARWLAPDGEIVLCTAAFAHERVTAGCDELGLGVVEHWDIVPREGKDVLVRVDVIARGRFDTANHLLVVRDRAGAWPPEFRTVRTEMGMPVPRMLRLDVDSDAVLDEIARRYHWWQTPERARADPARFLCQLMQLGTYEDVRTARRILGDDAFRDALKAAPPGVLDARSWNFWHRLLLGQPAPAMPERPLPP